MEITVQDPTETPQISHGSVAQSRLSVILELVPLNIHHYLSSVGLSQLTD